MKMLRAASVGILIVVTISLAGFAPSSARGATIQETAEKLYGSLSDEQRKAATLPFDSPERTAEVFTGGERAGIQIKKLDANQQKLAVELLASFTSEPGKAKAEAVMQQEKQDPGIGHYYLCFFGEVGAGNTYAWRIAEHHLTLVHLEVEKGEPKSFGPILLGADPPVLWAEEEEKMMALFAALTPPEREKIVRKGRGISTAPLQGEAIRVGELNPSAKEAAKAVLENRLGFFSDPIRQRAEKIIASQGGIERMQLAFWGEATKKSRDGGRWDFKLAGPSFLCDYENTRGHIHLSMKGRLVEFSP